MTDFKEKDALMMVRLFMDKWEKLPDEVDQDGEVNTQHLLDWMQSHYDSCMNLGLHRDADD